MGKIKWYKRDPEAALAGMMELSLEERGAYNTVLDLIYSKDGSLRDDERFIAGWLRVDVRIWKRIRQRLIDLKKLHLEDGFLRNIRATYEVDRGLSRIASARDAGNASAAKRNGTIKEIKDLASTSVQQAFNLLTTTPTVREERKKDSGGEILDSNKQSQSDRASPPSGGHSPRGEALKPDWKPDPGCIDYGQKLGLSQRQIDQMAEDMRLWAAANRNKAVARKADWSAAFKGWMRRESGKSKPFTNGGGYQRQPERPMPIDRNPRQMTAQDWQGEIKLYRMTGNWKQELGPEIGRPGCLVPPQLLGH